MAATLRTKTRLSWKLGVALIVTLALLFCWSIVLVKDKLLSNADDMGTRLAESYAAEEQSRFATYEMLMAIGAQYLDDQIAAGDAPEEMEAWLASYASYLAQVLGADIIDPYAVIDGSIVAAIPWEGDSSYDYAPSEWYQRALDAEGAATFTNAYTDAVTGVRVVTLSMQLAGEGNVIAFDIALDEFHTHRNRASMPDGSSYYLLDGNGTFVYADSALDLSDPASQDYLHELFDRVRDGSLKEHSASIRDIEGANRGVYYTVLDNGWTAIITIPLENILQDGWDATILSLALVSLLLVLAIIGIAVYESRKNRRIEHMAETLRILGDTFYAIYRIDLRNGTYETIKSSDDVRDVLGLRGSYQHFLAAVGDVVEAKTYAVFEEAFTPENIRRLAYEGVGEFGGDYRRRFGEVYKWVSIKVTFSDQLGPDEAIMSFREIDDEKRRQMQQQTLLENALNSAKQTAQRKNDFFSKVSHDMRTPLNAIIGLADLAKRNTDDPAKTAHDLARIEQSGQTLLTLVNDVLDMSRIEQGKGSTLDVAPMDLAKCVRDAASQFDVQAAAEGKELTVSVDVENPHVMGDAFRLGQVTSNLISNAVKYTTEGGAIAVELKEVSVGTKVNKYQFVVRDSGIGMTEEFLDHIFEPFARETTFSPIKVVGTGLGMPIVKSLVQQMSGEIAVESELGVGSTFTVTLPLQPAAGMDHLDDTPEESAAADDLDLTGMTVLVAEDNEINMEIACEYLDMMGASTIQAWNGREAVEAFAGTDVGAVDAVLMDMQMPEMDGCEACEAIRALDRSDARTVPIIAVTANAFAEDVSRTTAAGMNGHVSKPIDFAALMQALQEVLAGEKGSGTFSHS